MVKLLITAKKLHRFIHQEFYLIRPSPIGFREVVVASGSYDHHLVLRNHNDILPLQPKEIIMFNRIVIIDPEAHSVNFF